jgi:hypothetical protein
MTASYNAGKPGAKDPGSRHMVMLRSLECLYVEACVAKLGWVALLLGAAIEAVKDDLTVAASSQKMQHLTILPNRNLTVSRLLAALHEVEEADEEEPEAGKNPLAH